jgi:hypothetical protein
MRRLLVLGALVFVGSIGNVQARTITFEDLALDVPGNGGDRNSGGLNFDTLADHAHIINAGFNVYNGTNYMGIDDFKGQNPTTLSLIGGGPFALTSIDIAEWDNDSGAWSRHVVVTGNLFGGGTVSTTLTLDGIFDGVGVNADFQTFTFDAAWGNLSSVVLKGIGSTPLDGNYYAIDNVVVDDAAAPEPGTLTLLGLGSAGLIRRRCRNRR